MARLAKEPYPVPEGKDEETIKLLRERSNSLQTGEVVGALLKYQRADGYAYYLVVKDQPLTLQHVPVFDGYRVEPELIRGLTKDDILRRLETERKLAAILERQRRPMKYARPCDHCGGEIISNKVYRISKTDYWHCTGCGCIWTLDWVLKEKGPACPVHGSHG